RPLAAKAAVPSDIAQLRAHLEKEHQALHDGRDSDAIMLSARFHVGIAEIAAHSVFTNFVRDLVSHSSLIIALYWKRRDATCEKHAHHALVDAIEAGDSANAAALMNSHLVDLLSGLDLTDKVEKSDSLSDLLRF
ncbi:MAG: GntR family transcriptional regulator, partial [Mesorhizobium sp.]